VRKIAVVKGLCFLMVAAMFPLFASAQSKSESPHVGIGVKISTLGIGFEAAVPILPKLDVRAGANFFSYSRAFHQDGVTYNGSLSWRSGEASVDWFPLGGFHISPGLLFYNGNKITATALVPGGQNFTLSGTQYTSSASDPINGSGLVNFTKVDPKITFGFGNLVPRSGRHWSILSEFGIAFSGAPKAALAFQGTACDPQIPTACVNAGTDTTFQSNVVAEQAKINKNLKFFQFYPIASIGFGVNF
jgi:hypothetical protein